MLDALMLWCSMDKGRSDSRGSDVSGKRKDQIAGSQLLQSSPVGPHARHHSNGARALQLHMPDHNNKSNKNYIEVTTLCYIQGHETYLHMRTLHPHCQSIRPKRWTMSEPDISATS